ncbi:hypothetical protein CH379_003245 [Leptospira ellisii]|uniref:Lipoprotein n=2 Tax=Leptospira ellisii TaxID=2023197 RepID=A0AAE4QKE3_9LEPT|nr:hypothetical protein [Leptospira ellisii]MDV6234643.1 hypothetical protein [Leptospira ellisii]
MKSNFFLPLTAFAMIAALSSCSNYGGDQDKKSKDEDKKNCQAAAVSYLACTSSNPTPSSCDPLYLGVLALCGGGGGSGSYGSGGGY